MKLVRFKSEGAVYQGALDGHQVRVIGSWDDVEGTGETLSLDDIEFLAPTEPSKVICVGLNYTDHARELGMAIPEEPIIFLKPPTAVIGHEAWIKYPATSTQVDYEAELGVVIGKPGRDIKKADALDHILGYTCFNDVTARDLQRRDGQWTRAKSFDTFAPIGPWVVTTDEIAEPGNLGIDLYHNGEKKQSSNTRNLIFDIPTLVEFISGIMTLHEGDVIATGTPPGVGEMKRQDTVEVEIGGIGVLRNYVD
jgi:2-keto-4-pentenoate hydratase/2-oxohepta-3-ene-1,7-dioic acid hydratase in catechol pathway